MPASAATNFPKITGWIRAVAADFKFVKELGLKETGILTSASDYHIFLKLKKTRSQAMQSYLDIVKAALDNGILPRCHFEDITRADFDGFILPFAAELMKLSQQYKSPVKMRLCDTLGFGLPFPNATLPRSVPKLVDGLRKLGVPAEWLEWHGHNDLHKVEDQRRRRLALRLLRRQLLHLRRRRTDGQSAAGSAGHRTCRSFAAPIRRSTTPRSPNWPTMPRKNWASASRPIIRWSASDFNVTRAGIHADGLLKNEEIYNCFDTLKLLKRPAGVAITDKSRRRGHQALDRRTLRHRYPQA